MFVGQESGWWRMRQIPVFMNCFDVQYYLPSESVKLCKFSDILLDLTPVVVREYRGAILNRLDLSNVPRSFRFGGVSDLTGLPIF